MQPFEIDKVKQSQKLDHDLFWSSFSKLIFLVKLIHVSSPPLGEIIPNFKCSYELFHMAPYYEGAGMALHTIFLLFRVSLRSRLLRVVQKLEWTD
jgi:hypothetical protein